ncbi:mechanosensitive ion channel family protein [Haematomicrobium sanguinis]|uniref:mechanosensitive ion channel family protein n=1 Tax=Haematomicrobium sanguinis TaxID=479106 RepID=UPI0009FDC8D6|nr:mechanosensitive ion channel domain-containing protein [Haematomicrobium sanguinis]
MPSPTPSPSPSNVLQDVGDGVAETATQAWVWIWPLVAVAIAAVGAFILATVLRMVFGRIFRDRPQLRDSVAKMRWPFMIVVTTIASLIALNVIGVEKPWLPAVNFIGPLVLIAAIAWLAVVALGIAEAGVLHRYRDKISDARRMAKLRTQVTLLKRVISAVLITVAVAAMLLTIPEVRALGAGVLASAGLLSIVAGLAVQSSLTNVFAGLQLAFTDAIRINDVVVVDKQWGNVEEITLTYVVVTLFDETRLILPSTYFTTTPFQNWSRKGSELLGTVFLDVDWTVPVAEVRAELERILPEEPLWDKRVGSLVVTDAVGGTVQLRALVSARDSSDIWDLRCAVREKLVDFVAARYPEALPKQRWEMEPNGTAPQQN